MAEKNYDFTGVFEDEKEPSPAERKPSPKKEYNFEGVFEEDITSEPIETTPTTSATPYPPESIQRVNKELRKFKPIISDPLEEMDRDSAIALVKEYEKNGKESGWEIRKGFDEKGQWVDTLVRKTSIGPVANKSYEEDRKKLKVELDRLYFEERAAESNAFEQMMEGLTKPTEELVSGAYQLSGGEPGLLTPPTRMDIPFEHLTAPQKAAFAVGSIVGYAGPGSVINMGVKGVGKVIVNKTGTKQLVNAANKSAHKVVAKAVGKNPGVAKKAAGSYASKFIKNGPSLAAEGAAWEYLASGGDPEAAVEGAIMFALSGPAFGVLGEGVKRGLKKVLPKPVSGFKKQLAVSEKIRAEQEVKIARNAMAKELDGFNRYLRARDKTVDDFLFDPEKFAESEFQSKVKAAYTSSLLRAKKIDLQLKMQEKVTKLRKIADKKIKEYQKLEARLNKINEKFAAKKEGAIEYTSTMPRSINDVKASHGTRAKLEAQFGTLKNLKEEVGLVDDVSNLGHFYKLQDTLRENGFTQSQIKNISNQLMFPETIKKALTATKRIDIKSVGSKAAALESKLNRIKKSINKLEDNIQGKKRHPAYKELDSKIFKKIPIEERRRQLFMDSVVHQGLINPEMLETQLKKNAGFKLFNKSLLNQTERWNRVEEVTGVPIGKIVMDLIEGGYTKSHLMKEMGKQFNIEKDFKILKNLQADGKDLFVWFHYVERDPKTGRVIWNPEGLKIPGFEAPHFKELNMPEPSQEVKKILFKFREMTDWSFRNLDRVEDISYMRRYVARMKRVKTGGSVKRNLKEYKAQKAGLLLNRKLGQIDPKEAHLYETDLYELMPKMMQNSIRAASYSKALDNLLTADTMLRFMGMRNMADSLQKYAKRAMGAKTNEEAVELLSTHALKTSSDKIDAMIEMLGKQGDQSFKQDVVRAAYNLMYNSYLGQSTGLLKKQLLQPEIVGAAEVGMKNVVWAQSKAYVGPFAKKSRAHIERVKKQLYPEDIDYDMMGDVQRNWVNSISNVLSWPGKPGFKVFSFMDKKNRETMFLAGRRQLELAMEKGEGRVASVMEDLLATEKSQVIEAFNKEGREAALDVYGLIRSKRSNFAYTMAERGEFFSEGMGAMVPFVHWGANQWMRHIENLRQHNVGALSKRVAYAWASIATYQYLTNEQFYFTDTETPAGTIRTSSAHPISSMLGLAELSPFTTLEAIQTGEVLPAVRATKLLTKKKKKKKKIDPTDLFQFKPKKKKRR